jgi:hypothetical protein
MTKIETANARLTAAIEVRYAARDRYLASGLQADLDALNAAVAEQDAASAELAALGF